MLVVSAQTCAAFRAEAAAENSEDDFAVGRGSVTHAHELTPLVSHLREHALGRRASTEPRTGPQHKGRRRAAYVLLQWSDRSRRWCRAAGIVLASLN